MSFDFPHAYDPAMKEPLGLRPHANTAWWGQMFQGTELAAEVPAIRLSRFQWDTICEAMRLLRELHRSCPNGLVGAVIQGDVLAEAAERISSLSHQIDFGPVEAQDESG